MPQLETDVLGLELETVRKKVPVVFDRDNKFFGFVGKKEAEVVSNRDMRAPMKLRPGGKFGHYNPEGGDMGRGGGTYYDKAVINTVHLKHAIEWTKLSDMATDEKRKAVLSSFKTEVADALSEMRRHLDALCMTDGTGTLGTISAISVGGGIDGGDRVTLGTDGFGAKLVRHGQDLNVYATALGTNRTLGAERTVMLHNLQDKQIDLKAPSVAGMIVGDKIVISGQTTTPPVSLLGVPYHHSNASTGTWLGFNRANFPEIRANRVNAGGSLALAHPRLAINKIGDRVGIDEGKVKLAAWCHPCQAHSYEDLAQSVSVINKEAREQGIDLYFNESMQMAGAPVKRSYAWDKTRIDFITDIWGRCEMEAIDFMSINGKRIFEVRGPSGGVVASYLMYATISWNLFNENPAKGSYIDGLTVLSGY